MFAFLTVGIPVGPLLTGLPQVGQPASPGGHHTVIRMWFEFLVSSIGDAIRAWYQVSKSRLSGMVLTLFLIGVVMFLAITLR